MWSILWRTITYPWNTSESKRDVSRWKRIDICMFGWWWRDERDPLLRSPPSPLHLKTRGGLLKLKSGPHQTAKSSVKEKKWNGPHPSTIMHGEKCMWWCVAILFLPSYTQLKLPTSACMKLRPDQGQSHVQVGMVNSLFWISGLFRSTN